MKKIFLATCTAFMMPACGNAGYADNATTTAGAPHEFDAICGLDADTTFRIYEGRGLLQSSDFAAVSFQCVRPPVTANLPELIWSCAEVNLGERGYRVEILRESNPAETSAHIIRVDAAGSEHLETLSCQ